MISENEWVNPAPSEKKLVHSICQAWNLTPIVAEILIRRGYKTPESIQSFLNPSLKDLLDPFLLRHMPQAVEILKSHILAQKRIVILGDYDVDGITATALILEFLEACGANDLDYFIPNRLQHGYGLTDASTDILIEMKPDLVVTVDNGITAVKEVQRLVDNNIKVIVTDHHLSEPGMIPDGCVVNPNHPECTYKFNKISGCGVALKLIMALRKKFRDEGYWTNNRPEPNLLNSLDLAALGTVADVVPLVEENRILTYHGLKVMNEKPRVAFQTLKKLKNVNTINSRTLSFQFAPLLNASGRMEDANIAVRFLLTKNPKEADDIAHQLENTNLERREKESEMVQVALQLAEKQKDDSALVLCSPDFHEGINGIVATRVMEIYNKPVIILSDTGEVLKGSGRSIAVLNLKEALSHCSDLLGRFGGHSAAAGCSLKKNNLYEFKNQLQTYCSKNIPSKYKQKVYLDGNMVYPSITDSLMMELQKLEPYGAGNPEALFKVKTPEAPFFNLKGKHVKWQLNKNMDMLGWNLSEKFTKLLPLDLAVNLSINEFRGLKKLQLTIQKYKYEL